MNKIILITGAILGVLAIIFGAFGAHGLKAYLSPENLQTFETGVKYQMYHALFLMFIGSSSLVGIGYKNIIFYLVIIGVFLFSGSIYGLTTNHLTNFNFKSIGFVTPIGGVFLIAAWITLIVNFIKLKS